MAKESPTYRAHSSTDSILDIQSALGRLGGDEELLSDMIGFFIEDGPHLMNSIQAAADAKDAPATRKAAHALKGLILSCGGVRAGRAAQAVENMAHMNEMEEIELLIENLKSEFDVLVEATLPYRKGHVMRPSSSED